MAAIVPAIVPTRSETDLATDIAATRTSLHPTFVPTGPASDDAALLPAITKTYKSAESAAHVTTCCQAE